MLPGGSILPAARAFAWLTLLVAVTRAGGEAAAAEPPGRPNLLIAIADDQSYPHASAYGAKEIATPGFDQVARQGMLFRQAFTPAPGCSPMRAAFLTGQAIWQIGPAGTHASSFPADLHVFPDRLEQAGYVVGYTGKGWGPGNYRISGRDRNPAGPAFQKRKIDSPVGISGNDYAGNFADFLQARQDDAPFCFWYGGHEPHRGYGAGLGAKQGIDPGTLEVPAFLPDRPEIRSDLADYYFEIEWFDQHLQRMLKQLEAAGELDNTLVIVTSDNGMPFPRAKANLYEYGIHMPLAISWPQRVAAGQSSDRLVSLLDVTATIYDAAEVKPAVDQPLAGRSLVPLLTAQEAPPKPAWPTAVFSGRERHSSSRFNSLGYPCRAIRTDQFLYIRNYKPQRWPAGTPQKYASVAYDAENQPHAVRKGPPHGGYHDIDGCPSLTFLIDHRDQPDVAPLFHAAVDKRPPEELYQIEADPACLRNLALDPAFAAARQQLAKRLGQHLRETGDLRELDPQAAAVWETYPRYSHLRWFPEPAWAKADPGEVPDQAWLEARRPSWQPADQADQAVDETEASATGAQP